MRLGFIGTGVITEAIITGVVKSEYPVSDIFVSLRNREVSKRLAMMSSKVKVLDDNQAIIDQSDMIFLAVLPQQAEKVLFPLHFGDLSQIVSLIATISIERLRKWTSLKAPLSRVVPLPIVANHDGMTTVFPPSKTVQDLFGHHGKVVPIETIETFNALVVASTTMGLYFDTLETMAQWLGTKGATTPAQEPISAPSTMALRRRPSRNLRLDLHNCDKTIPRRRVLTSMLQSSFAPMVGMTQCLQRLKASKNICRN